MKRSEFDSCLEEAKKMFHMKELSPYVADVFFDEFSNIEKSVFLEAMATTAATGLRFTLDNIYESIEKTKKGFTQESKVTSDCTYCSGGGVIVVNNFAFSCFCKAGVNYPNYPKFNYESNNQLAVTEDENLTYRSFGNYRVAVPKGSKSVKDISFTFKNPSKFNNN